MHTGPAVADQLDLNELSSHAFTPLSPNKAAGTARASGSKDSGSEDGAEKTG